MQELCFELGIDYDDLGEGSRKDKAHELIAYIERHNQGDKLQALLMEKRPHLFRE